MVLIAATVTLVASVSFLLIYAFIMEFRNSVATNIWVGILSLAFLSLAGIITELHGTEAADEVAVFAYFLAAFVAVWRIFLIFKFRKEDKNIEEEDRW